MIVRRASPEGGIDCIPSRFRLGNARGSPEGMQHSLPHEVPKGEGHPKGCNTPCLRPPRAAHPKGCDAPWRSLGVMTAKPDRRVRPPKVYYTRRGFAERRCLDRQVMNQCLGLANAAAVYRSLGRRSSERGVPRRDATPSNRHGRVSVEMQRPMATGPVSVIPARLASPNRRACRSRPRSGPAAAAMTTK